MISSFHSGTGTDFYHLLWCVRNDRSSIIPAVWIYQIQSFLPGCCGLGMNSGAYLCEIIRAGIQSIDGGQTEAARSLGLSQTQNLRYIIFPQALKNILPAIANEFVVIIKESAITYTIGVQDIMGRCQQYPGCHVPHHGAPAGCNGSIFLPVLPHQQDHRLLRKENEPWRPEIS